MESEQPPTWAAPEFTVGDLAARIWQGAGLEGEPSVELLGIRRGETMGDLLDACLTLPEVYSVVRRSLAVVGPVDASSFA